MFQKKKIIKNYHNTSSETILKDSSYWLCTIYIVVTVMLIALQFMFTVVPIGRKN